MLTAYFKNPRILARYEQGPAGPELEAFAAWLAQRGFQRSSVCRCIRIAHKFTLWGIDAGLILPRLDRDALAAFAEPLRLKHSSAVLRIDNRRRRNPAVTQSTQQRP